MRNKTLARRYAQALFEIAKEKNAVSEFAKDLFMVVSSLETSEELKKVIQSRQITAGAKKNLVRELLTKDLDPMIINFINLVFDKSREAYFSDILDSFNELVDQENKVIKAEVRSAERLDDGQRQRLEAKLSRITGTNVQTKVEIDPSLIGGLLVKIGDVVYDGSVAKQLAMLQEHLQHVELGR